MVWYTTIKRLSVVLWFVILFIWNFVLFFLFVLIVYWLRFILVGWWWLVLQRIVWNIVSQIIFCRIWKGNVLYRRLIWIIISLVIYWLSLVCDVCLWLWRILRQVLGLIVLIYIWEILIIVCLVIFNRRIQIIWKILG